MQLMKLSKIDREKEKARLAYKVKQSFIGRNFYLFYGVCIVYFAAAVWSMTTAGGNLYIRSAGMLGENIFAAIAAGIGAVALIGLQFISGKGAVDDMQIGIFRERKNASGESEYLHSLGNRAFFILKCCGFVAATAVSITLSIDGVKVGNEWFRYEKRPPVLAQADVSFYDAEIQRIAQNIETERSRKWKGVLVTDASRRIADYEKQQAAIRDQRAATIAAVDARNAKKMKKWQEETERNSFALQGFGGVAEVVIIFCVIFIGLYDDGLYREANAKAAGANTVPMPAGMGFQRSAMAAERKDEMPRNAYGGASEILPIGFHTAMEIRGTSCTPPQHKTGDTKQGIQNRGGVSPVPSKKVVPPDAGIQKRSKYTDSERARIERLKGYIKTYKRREQTEAVKAKLKQWQEEKEGIQNAAKNRQK